MIPSHPVRQQPDRLIAFSHVAATVEQEGRMIPFMNEAFSPGQRFDERREEVSPVRVLRPPQDEIERDFPKRLNSGLGIARVGR